MHKSRLKLSQVWQPFLAFILLHVMTPVVESYCWQPGRNPSFTGPPKVEQIDMRTVRVSWFGLVSMRECADQFLVKYWQENNPQGYKLSDLTPNDANFINIDVVPKVDYVFQAVAREDKGGVAGIDWNKSETVNFKTSQYNAEVEPTVDPAPSVNSLPANGDGKRLETSHGNLAASSSGPSQSPTNEDNLKGIFSEISVELIAIIVVCSVVLLLIVVGLVYKLACAKKSEDDDMEDDDEDDDDEAHEKKKLEA